MAVSLRADGWAVVPAVVAPHMRDGPKHLLRSMVSRSADYYLAMSMSEHIFQRGSDRIHHSMVAGYYHCLVTLESLHGFHDRPDFGDLKNADFVDICKHGDATVVLPPRPLALPALAAHLEGADWEGGGGGGAAAALPLLGDEPPALALGGDVEAAAIEMLGAAVPDAVVVAAPPAARSMRIGDFKINVDNYSHSSGRQRAYITCLAHKPCFKYCTVDMFPSFDRCAAWL
eukprot:5482189-Pyramimonas_sp.AAC.1